MHIKSIFSIRKWIFLFLSKKAVRKRLSDESYLRLQYYSEMGRHLNLKNPRGLSEKLQWLKLYDRKPEHTVMVDKYLVRDYIKQKLGEEYLIPLLGVWEKAEDVAFDKLPDKFVLKCNHNSGTGMCICEDKASLDIKHTIDELNRGLNEDYFLKKREWPYKNVPRRIVAEQFMTDDGKGELKDYKIFNFNGKPEFIQVDFDRFNDHKQNIYSVDWKLLDFSFSFPQHPEIEIPKPDNLDEMLRFAEILSKNEAFVRTDFYSINGKTYFGEITFFPTSGYAHKFFDKEHDIKYGNMIKLPERRV